MNTDMDYKELIRRLVDCDQLEAAIEDDNLSLALEDAADAIETLLAERDAAVKELRGECRCCANNTGWHNIGKCAVCLHETAPIPLPGFNRVDSWQWSGPQEGENHD